MEHKIFYVIIVTGLLLLSSCNYMGYEFEVEEWSYTPPELREPIKGVTGNGNGEINGEYEEWIARGGSRARPPTELLPAKIIVNVRPENAKIALDGVEVGVGSATLERSPGAYNLVVESPGHNPYSTTIIASPGVSNTYDIRLYPEWLPAEERITIDSFSVSDDETIINTPITIRALYSGPGDTECSITADGSIIGTANQRNIENTITHSFSSAGTRDLTIECTGLRGTQSLSRTVIIHECLEDDHCPETCIAGRCVTEQFIGNDISFNIEYFNRWFLWFGRWREYDDGELPANTRVRMIIEGLPENTRCSPIGTDIALEENTRSKPITLSSPASIGIRCDNGQELIRDVMVYVEGGIIGGLMD